MDRLANCFPNNVLIATKKVDTSQRNSINQLHAYLNCMEQLSQPYHKWDRLMLLENHDFPIKTLDELRQSLEFFGMPMSWAGITTRSPSSKASKVERTCQPCSPSSLLMPDNLLNWPLE